MDNRIFRVNGENEKQLLNALKLLLTDKYDHVRKVDAFKVDPEKGIILYWLNKGDGVQKFVPEISLEMLAKWIMSELEKPDLWNSVKYEDFTDDCDHDGDNNQGWILFTERWGRIDGEEYSLCSIKPAFTWYGK